MLERLLQRLHNRFSVAHLSGTFTVTGGAPPLDDVPDGQYFWVEGSVFNDGLHQYPASDMHDETFTGRVVLLAVPPAVVDLAERIDTWCEANAEALDSPYQSESFGGYSYSKANSSGGNDAAVSDWEAHFASEMAPWKRMNNSGW